MTTRIAPLSPAELNDEQRELIGGLAGGIPATNIFATLVRHPGLFRKWLPFGGKLLAGKLPARDRELLILRTAWHCRSDYEWGQHVRVAHDAGLSADEIEAITQPFEARAWSSADTTLLRAADELHDDARVADATWSTLAAQYDERQLIEILFVVGQYHMVAYALNSLGVEVEAGLPHLPPTAR